MSAQFEPSPAFHTAVKESKQLKEKPADDELLKLYAFYKQTLQTPKFEESEQPSMWDFKGKAKRRAWQDVAKLKQKDADKEYVDLVNDLKGRYGIDPSKAPEAVGKK